MASLPDFITVCVFVVYIYYLGQSEIITQNIIRYIIW